MGIVAQLRRGVEDAGRKGVYNFITLLEAPPKGWPSPGLHFYYKAGCSLRAGVMRLFGEGFEVVYLYHKN